VEVLLDGGGPGVQPDAKSVVLHEQQLVQKPDARNVRMPSLMFISSEH